MRMIGGMRVSIIVPVGPGDAAWHGLVDCFVSEVGRLPPGVEVILVFADAVPPMAPAAIPQAPGWRTIAAPCGRACQQNAGARSASGRWLCFLHADSRLDRRAWDVVLGWERTAPALYYFDLSFLPDGPRMTRLNALGVRWRCRLLGLPFGDQGLLVTNEDFGRAGGFDESLASGEDHALVWALRRAGRPVLPAGATIATSARKYAQHGWWRTTAHHLGATWMQARRFARGSEDDA
jgi:hypothetical protein